MGLEELREEAIKHSLVLKLDNYQENALRFFHVQPYFYDKNNIFWLWSTTEFKWCIVDSVDIMNKLDKMLCFEGQTISNSIKSNYLEALKRVGRQHIPIEAPKKWIQFMDKAYSLKSGKIHQVTPDFFFTNPIAWELGETPDTPMMDKLFTEWVGETHLETLYQLISYCCYTDYPIQLLFCLYGSGRNGKSCFLKVLDTFLGKDNTCTTNLDLIAGNNKSRFETFKLYKKLICIMGETNFGVLSNTSIIKQLVGGDKIGYEKKNSGSFDDYNYAKMIIASNSLPTTSDTTEGFFRRWLIIDFPNEFPEGKDITKTIPPKEFNNLAKKVTILLPKLLESGFFANQGSILDRKIKYIEVSNPLSLFLEKCCDKAEDAFVLYSELYTAYILYLKLKKKRRIKMAEFKSALEDEGFWVEKTSKKVGEIDGYSDYKVARWVDGLRLKSDWKNNYANYANYATLYTHNPYIGINPDIEAQKAQKAQNPERIVKLDQTEEYIE